jgi:GAF domain-containing protein
MSTDAPLSPEARTLFETVAELTATALERARLGQEISAARTAAEAERVRNMRIPMKPDAYSKVKPDIYSVFIPDSVPI